MLEVAGGPAMGGMISVMGTGQVLNFVNKSYETYSLEKAL